MSGAMRKIGEYLGLLEDTGVYDDQYDEQGYADTDPRRAPVPARCGRSWQAHRATRAARPGRRASEGGEGRRRRRSEGRGSS